MLTRSWKLFGIAIIVAGLVQVGCNGDDPDPDFGGPDTGVEDDSEVPDPDSDVPDPDSDVPDPDSDVPDPDSDVPDPDSDVPDPDGDVPDPDGDVPDPDGDVPDPDLPVGPLPEWTLEPAEGAAFEGDYGEEFDPNSAEYDLTNDGTEDLNFETTLTEPWLSVDPASGTIAPGDTLTVTVTVLGEEEMKATMGEHTTTVTFEFNGMESETDTREIALKVYNPGNSGWAPMPDPAWPFGDPATEWDAAKIYPSVMIKPDGTIMVWYVGMGEGEPAIGHTTSPDGITWDFQPAPVLEGTGNPADWDMIAYMPSVVFDDATSTYHMFYVGQDDNKNQAIGHATSLDGITWDKSAANPVIESAGEGVEHPAAIWDGDQIKLWYADIAPSGAVELKLSTSPDGDVWTEDPANPLHTFTEPIWLSGLAVLKDGTDSIYRLWYMMETEKEEQGQMEKVRMGIFYAASPDGVNWDLTENEDDAVVLADEEGWNSEHSGLSVWRDNVSNLSMVWGACASEEDEGCGIGYASNEPPGMISGTLSVDGSVVCGTDPENDCIGTVLVMANACAGMMCDSPAGYFNYVMVENVDLSNSQTFEYLIDDLPASHLFITVQFWEAHTPAIKIGPDGGFPPPAALGDLKLMVPLEVDVLSDQVVGGQDAVLERLVPTGGSVHGTVFIDPGAGLTCDANPDTDCVGDLAVLIMGQQGPFDFVVQSNVDVSTDPAPYIMFDLPAGNFTMAAIIMDAGGQLGGEDFPPIGSLVSDIFGGGTPVTVDAANPVELDIPLVQRWTGQ